MSKSKSSRIAPIVAIDFSSDSLIIQSSDIAEDLCYHDVTTGNVIGSPSTVKDMNWATWTLPIGFPVKNLQLWFPEPDDCTALQQSNSGDLIAIGDRYGFLRIMSFPVIEEEMGYRKSRGHCAPLRNLKWSNDDEFLISTGAGDGCVIMWKHFKDKTLDSGEEAGESKARTYHWLHTMNALGHIQTGTGDLTANYPAAMAFKKNNTINYVAYNYKNTNITVTFSDGKTMIVAPNSFKVETN